MLETDNIRFIEIEDAAEGEVLMVLAIEIDGERVGYVFFATTGRVIFSFKNNVQITEIQLSAIADVGKDHKEKLFNRESLQPSLN